MQLKTLEMEEDKKPASRKSSVANSNGKEKDKVSNGGGGGDIQLKAKMSLLNGITVIVGSIIGNCNTKIVPVVYEVKNNDFFILMDGMQVPESLLVLQEF